MSLQAAETEILSTIKDLEVVISLSDAVKRLEENPDFKRVVSEGYFKDNAVRLVHILASPAIAHSEPATKKVHEEMAAIALFRDFLSQIHKAADRAEQTIAQNQEELVRIRNEDDGEE